VLRWFAFFSALSLTVYCIVAAFNRKLNKDSLHDIFSVFFYTGTMINGIRLVLYTLTENAASLARLEEADSLYIFIGGFAMGWIAFWELEKKYKELFRRT